MSQEHATSHPPPNAKPSIIAIVGLVNDQSDSTALSVNFIFVALLSMPTNSEISAPATNEFGFARLPSCAGSGFAPVMTRHLISSLSSTHAQSVLRESITSTLRALSLLGRLIVARATYPPTVESVTGILSTFNTALLGSSMSVPSQST